jgi:mutator protein MutT
MVRYCPGCRFTSTPLPVHIRVVASVIEQEGRLLLCQRPAHKRHGGLWEFPGGKVEPGESDFEAVERELAEELGVKVVEVGAVELSVRDAGSEFVIEFLPVVIQGEPQALEHAALAWVTEEELLGLALAPSDRRYARFRVGAAAGEAAE